MTTILHEFTLYLYQVGYSAGTQNMLPACVGEFLEQQRIKDISYVQQVQVKEFYSWLQQRPLKRGHGGLSEMMISHYVYALKTFFSWLEVTEQISYNPISGLKFKRAKGNTRQPLTVTEIQQLFTEATTFKEIAVLHLFYSCGLRRSEGEALNTSDIHYKKRLLYVRAGKGAKRRVVPITDKVAKDLEAYYLQDRCSGQVKRVKDEEAYMLNKGGYRMKGDQYNTLLKELTAKAGIADEVTLHHLRHSIATHLLQSGMAMEKVRDFLGHYTLETTQHYAKPDMNQLKLL